MIVNDKKQMLKCVNVQIYLDLFNNVHKMKF